MRIILCDDHRVFSEALAELLVDAGHQVVGLFGDPVATTRHAVMEGVDACLMDLCFPGHDGSASVAAIAAVPGCPTIVVLTACVDAALLNDALRAGASGIALKSDDFTEVLHVVSQAVSRKGAFPPVVSRRAVEVSARALASTDPVAQHPLARFLTPREREVLRRLVQGETTAMLAVSMGVRTSTARSHIDAVLTKLGAHSRLQAISYAVSEGLVDLDELLPAARSSS